MTIDPELYASPNLFAYLMCETALTDDAAVVAVGVRKLRVQRWRKGDEKAPLWALKSIVRLRDKQDEVAEKIAQQLSQSNDEVFRCEVPATDEEARKLGWPSRASQIQCFRAAWLYSSEDFTVQEDEDGITIRKST